MKTTIAIVNCPDIQVQESIVTELTNNTSITTIYSIASEGEPNSSTTMQLIAEVSEKADYILFVQGNQSLKIGQFAIERLESVAESTQATMVYSDYWEVKSGNTTVHPVIDYQKGSLRDDFDFGALQLIDGNSFRAAANTLQPSLTHSASYAMRLKLSETGELLHLSELLYTIEESDLRLSGQKIFDYVDPKNRAVQIEMEQVVTEHLKAVDGYLAPNFTPVEFDSGSFSCKASVIIPVRNRERTIADAIESVLLQKADFEFNVLVVDNHSTDRTSEIIEEYAQKDSRVIHLQPQRTDLGIGGCWNYGAHNAACGQFTIQLDSDDLYKDEHTITKIVAAFEQEQCAMVVGSYELVNFDLEPIPPGLIDHKEWTPDNGRNNALRINGLGAPRAFYTPILRELKLPNTSYGEDYALALHISRNYSIGRVYDSLYLCRRWEENSDASLPIEKMNAHNHYKDSIRTIELKARQNINKK